MGRHSRSRSRSRDRRGGGGDGGADDNYDAEHDGYRIHIADLGVNCSQKELEKTFRKFGEFRELWLARNPPCFAFVNYKHRNDAESAIKETDNRVVCGSRVRVSWARPRTRGGRSSRFDSTMRCYQCGERGHFSRECTGRSRGGRDDDRRRGGRRSGRRSRSRSRSRSRHRRRSSHSRSRSRSRSPRNRRDRADDAKVNGNGADGAEQNGKKDNRSRSRSRDRRRNRDRSYDRRRSRSRSGGRRRRSRSRSNRRRYSRSTSRDRRPASADKAENGEAALVNDEVIKNNGEDRTGDALVENNENGDRRSKSRSMSRERSEERDRHSPADDEEFQEKEENFDPPTNEENQNEGGGMAIGGDDLSNQGIDHMVNTDYQSNNEEE